MRLLLVIFFFLILNVLSTRLTSWRKRSPPKRSVKYVCGSGVFQELALQLMVLKQRSRIVDNLGILQKPLYGYGVNYKTLLIRKETIPSLIHNELKYPYNKSYIVLNDAYQIVDVITEMIDGNYIKCKKIDESAPESSSAGENEEYDYQCGVDRLSYETLRWTLAQAMTELGKSSTHPAPYRGNPVLPEYREYRIHPVSIEKMHHRVIKVMETPYNIVFDRNSQLIDVIAQLYSREYTKCERVATIPDEAQEQQTSEGYLCGIEFFDLNYIKYISSLALEKSVDTSRQFPHRYMEPLFNQECWIYPLLCNRRIYDKGRCHSKYFVLMNIKFQFITVVMKMENGMQLCKKSSKRVESVVSEKDDFFCRSYPFSSSHLAATVANACKSINKPQRAYPAMYIGPGFNVPGPYLTWPLMKKNFFMSSPGKYRIVINKDCQLAGVIAKKELLDNTYYKCKRKSTGLIPGGESKAPITESYRVEFTSRVGKKGFSKNQEKVAS